MNPRFPFQFDWIIIALIAATLATCCVKEWKPKELEGNCENVMQVEDTEAHDKNLF